MSAPSSDYDVDLFVIGAGSGGTRAARIASQHGARGDDRRGIPRRRHLRDPRLRAEEADGLREPLRRRFRGGRRASAGACRSRPSTGARWLRCQGKGDHPALRHLRAEPRKSRRRESSTRARAIVDAHTVALADGREVRAKFILVATGAYPHRARPCAGARADDLVERDLRSSRISAKRLARHRRGLYRRRVRLGVRAARFAGDCRRAWQGDPARLRRGHA